MTETRMMIQIEPGLIIAKDHILEASIDRRFYMNGSTVTLIIKLSDGREIRREHGFGFDAYAILDKLLK